MAAFLRVVSRQGCRLLMTKSSRNTPLIQPACTLFTSKKTKDTVSASTESSPPLPSDKGGSLLDKEENWISYGYDLVDREFDEFSHKSQLFFMFTVLLGFGGLFLTYYPDFKGKDWAQREAFLQIAKREAAGQPLIDPNYVPVDSVNLPTDEELGDTEIII